MKAIVGISLAFGIVGVAVAQVPEVGHKCVSGCDVPSSPSSSSSSSSSGPVGLDPAQQQELMRQQQQQQMMMDTAGQLGFALGTALGKALSGEGEHDKAWELNEQAKAAWSRGDVQGARALLLQALEHAPDDQQLKDNLAQVDREISRREQVAAAQQQQAEAARQEAERQAEIRRREEMSAHLNGQLKMARPYNGPTGATHSGLALKGIGGAPMAVASTSSSSPALMADGTPLKLGDTGTHFFGTGGNASASTTASSADAPHVIDARDGANGQPIGGAGVQQGPADTPPAATHALDYSSKKVTLNRAATAASKPAATMKPGVPATQIASAQQSQRKTTAPLPGAHVPAGAGARNASRALDCVMNDVYQAAGALGSAGDSLVAQLREQARQARYGLSHKQPPANAAQGVYELYTGSLDSMSQGVKSDHQLVVRTQITRDVATGETHLDVLYQVDGKGHTADGQAIVILDKDGGVACQQVPPAVAQCLSQFSPGSAQTDFCPKAPGVTLR